MTGLLKLYFRELPDPLFPRRMHSELKHLEKIDPEHVEQSLPDITQMVQSLPEPNQAVLQVLLKLLLEVAEHREVNKMSFTNLAIVFSPTLGCPMEVLTPLIQHYHVIFEAPLIEM